MTHSSAHGIALDATCSCELMGSAQVGEPASSGVASVRRRKVLEVPVVSGLPPNDNLVIRVTTVTSDLRGHQRRYRVFETGLAAAQRFAR